jgi:hypothetical protein
LVLGCRDREPPLVSFAECQGRGAGGGGILSTHSSLRLGLTTSPRSLYFCAHGPPWAGLAFTLHTSLPTASKSTKIRRRYGERDSNGTPHTGTPSSPLATTCMVRILRCRWHSGSSYCKTRNWQKMWIRQLLDTTTPLHTSNFSRHINWLRGLEPGSARCFPPLDRPDSFESLILHPPLERLDGAKAGLRQRGQPVSKRLQSGT